MREKGIDELHLRPFFNIFLRQPIFESYMVNFFFPPRWFLYVVVGLLLVVYCVCCFSVCMCFFFGGSLCACYEALLCVCFMLCA